VILTLGATAPPVITGDRHLHDRSDRRT
jgi:hypothetical protein